jgi:two-component system, NtrC family, sensor kinase
MNPQLQHILDIIAGTDLPAQQQVEISNALKVIEREISIAEFKLDRTEKVKRTTAILLEETIEELEQKRKAIEETNLALQKSLEELKAAQNQLIQQEKLASLGQLTAGIAHEIKNPLNFVNNFSEVSLEMVDEAIEELRLVGHNTHAVETIAILTDIKANLTKIHEHGSRADGIVKSMLMHSRGGTGTLEPTDLNGLVREYVNLAFHGMRAGKHVINVDIDLDLDESVGQVPLIAEDFSRVILNLCNNAFDAMREMGEGIKDKNEEFAAKLSVRTKRDGDKVSIEIEDNGIGITADIKDKILQPFFTTKKGTQGTGLGLSITHDIIKAHGGNMDVLSKPGQTLFTINFYG